MQYVSLGNSGLKVSRVALGCMNFGMKASNGSAFENEDCVELVKHALNLGINFFDTADVYGLGRSEEILGSIVANAVTRDQVVISTKLCLPMGSDVNQRGLSRKHIRHAVEESLRRLKCDYVDLIQIHRFDPDTPIDETLEALDLIVKQGKALYIGASSMFAWQFSKMCYAAYGAGDTRFISMQNNYNLVYREDERELIPFCRSEGIGLIPWGPLARGFLSSLQPDREKFSYHLESDFEILTRAGQIATNRGMTAAQIATSWVLNQPGVSAVIIGASSAEHLNDADIASEICLRNDELQVLGEKYVPRNVFGHS